jgi:uncharacterized protein (DUF983 family)
MPEAARNVDQEFWRPPAQAAPSTTVVRGQAEVCPRCHTEFVLGSRYCHVCGAERDALPGYDDKFTRWFDLHVITGALGLTVGSLVAFIVGIACVIAAITTGLMYTATTTLDWQAIQVWRIQWLLGALVAFAAGILLKRAAS